MPSSNKRAGEEMEGNEKKKAGASSRTGQACDRCKIRKIRCDARPGGCSPCLQNNSECKTTDRITGRATSRGHTEHIENENASLKMYMVELQQQLREHGLEPKPPPSMSPGYVPSQTYWGQDEQPRQQGSWGDLNTAGGLIATSARLERQGSQSSALPDFRPGSGDNYLGVSVGSDWLSPIEGTSLALFGMKIDIADFLPADSDPTAAAMSYQTFLSHAFGKTQPTYPPQLPHYDECKLYSEWYFRSVQVFTPVLHKPDFMQLLQQVCHGQRKPSPAEIVMLHMVISIMKFQYSSRNGLEQLRNEAMHHYHYAVNFIPDLVTGHTLEDIQAVVLICCQLRNQPRPGAAWIFIHNVFGLCIELGLHRSSSAWQASQSERDPHANEMRKRVFWTVLTLHINICGKLGRPMPIRLEDFDVEIPEATPDHTPEETNLSKWRKCSFRAALQGFKLVKILMQVHSTVYSIRAGTEPYDLSIKNLDKQLQDFRTQLPVELTGGTLTVDEDRVPALYLQTVEQSTRLLLHHPSLARSISPQIMTNNLDVCLDASSKLLSVTLELKALKGLDTTWHQTTEYLAAIFTTLFAYMQKKDQMDTSDLQRLRHDMNNWIDVVGEVGTLLGAGLRLQEAVRNVIDQCITNILQHIAARTATAGLASSGSPTTATGQPQQQSLYPNTNGFVNAYSNGSMANDTQHRTSYPPATTFYSQAPNGTMAQYSSAPMALDSAAFANEDIKPNIHAQLHVQSTTIPLSAPQQNQQGTELAPHQPSNAYVPALLPPLQIQDSAAFHNEASPSPTLMVRPSPAAWRNFADDMMTNMSGQEYVNSANALMALGTPKDHEMGMTGANLDAMHLTPDGQQPWPLNMYTTPNNNPQ